jgi:plastocyanin
MKRYARGLAGASAAAVLALFTYAGTPGDQQTVHTVTITYNASTGAVAASPDTVRAHPGERIQWTSAHPWRVNIPLGAAVFGAAGRGQARSFQGQPNQANGAPVIPAAAQRGYKYSVAVFDGEQWRERDPEIIIAPPR